MKCDIIVRMYQLIGFFLEFSEPVVVRVWTDAVIRHPLLGSHALQAALALRDDVQPVGMSDIVGDLIHGITSCLKKALSFFK